MIEDDEIRALVTRLARPDRHGGHTVERAAILAAGPDAVAIEAWILAHAGTAEPTPATRPSHAGLHQHASHPAAGAPRRFVLPFGEL